jgi:hypothetical protein
MTSYVLSDDGEVVIPLKKGIPLWAETPLDSRFHGNDHSCLHTGLPIFAVTKVSFPRKWKSRAKPNGLNTP